MSTLAPRALPPDLQCTKRLLVEETLLSMVYCDVHLIQRASRSQPCQQDTFQKRKVSLSVDCSSFRSTQPSSRPSRADSKWHRISMRQSPLASSTCLQYLLLQCSCKRSYPRLPKSKGLLSLNGAYTPLIAQSLEGSASSPNHHLKLGADGSSARCRPNHIAAWNNFLRHECFHLTPSQLIE